MSNAFGAARFSSWALKQWPVPLVAAVALVVMLAAQRFGVTGAVPARLPDTKATQAAKLEGLPLAQTSAVLTIADDDATPAPPSPPPAPSGGGGGGGGGSTNVLMVLGLATLLAARSRWRDGKDSRQGAKTPRPEMIP